MQVTAKVDLSRTVLATRHRGRTRLVSPDLVHGLLDVLIPGSFRDGTFPDAPVQWQQIIYFSYTTLTSSGYGDILPVSWWARSLANLEMIAGVLFITIIMSRLVALYSENRGEKLQEK